MIEGIFLLRRLMKTYSEKKKDFYIRKISIWFSSIQRKHTIGQRVIIKWSSESATLTNIEFWVML